MADVKKKTRGQIEYEKLLNPTEDESWTYTWKD
jgi:hypothetical protein